MNCQHKLRTIALQMLYNSGQEMAVLVARPSMAGAQVWPAPVTADTWCHGVAMVWAPQTATYLHAGPGLLQKRLLSRRSMNHWNLFICGQTGVPGGAGHLGGAGMFMVALAGVHPWRAWLGPAELCNLVHR